MGFFNPLNSILWLSLILNLNMNADFTFKKNKDERTNALYYSADKNFEELTGTVGRTELKFLTSQNTLTPFFIFFPETDQSLLMCSAGAAIYMQQS